MNDSSNPPFSQDSIDDDSPPLNGFIPDFDNDESRLSAPDTLQPTPADTSRAESVEKNPAGPEAATAPRFTVDKRINEDYKLWKKNIPFLYDCFMMTASQFPTYTVDWINELEEVVDEETGAEYRQQKIVTGTTARNEDDKIYNGIIIMNVRFPAPGENGLGQLDEKKPDFKPNIGLFSTNSSTLSIHGIVPQSCPLIHVCVMPQKPRLVCAKLADSSVVIYDWKNELKRGWSFDLPIKEHAPLLELLGHDNSIPSAHGLSWNPTTHKEGLLASCGKDGKIIVWDINGVRRRDEMDAYLTITGHPEVQDIAWHPIHSTLIGSAGMDKCFCLFDIRSRNLKKPSHRVEAHTAGVNAISFALSEVLFATSSDDMTVGLWDIRNLGRKVHSLQGHTSDVFALDWCHDVERATLLASAGADRRIYLWDIAKIGESVERPVEVNTPPELIFVHGGHTGRVTDVCWNPALGRKLMLASVAEDAILQVWMPAKYQVSPLEKRRQLPVEETTTLPAPNGASNTSAEVPASKEIVKAV